MAQHPYRVRVVSSYIYDEGTAAYADMGKQNRWVNGFVTSLVRQKSGLREFDLQFVRTPPLAKDLATLVQRLRNEKTQLIICPGTDSAIRVAELVDDIPIIYFGAHPENNGLELLYRENVTGIRLNLPLIWNYQNFSFLKQVMPNLERVYAPLNLRSEFAFPNVRKNYEIFRERSSSFWIPGGSSCVGYRSVAFMAEALGVEYFEGPYDTVEQLDAGLREASSEGSAFVGFNDTVLQGAAVDRLLSFTAEKSRPLIWVNNVAIIKRFGVLDYSSDFYAVGQLLGSMTMQVLRDHTPIKAIPFHDDPGQKVSVNLTRCRELGLETSPAALSFADDLLEAP